MGENKITKGTKKHRRLEELNLLDDFLFQEMVSQEKDGEEFCRILLSTILGRPIRRVKVIPQKNVLGLDTDRHGIRLDAYIEDVSEIEAASQEGMIDARISSDIYDIEPNNTYEKHSLPKRMRYYHGLIDTQLLAAGMDYEKLQNVMMIIILPYDPFGRNRMVYTIKNQCVEDTNISYDDGAKKIFLYTKGTEGNPSQALQDMLKYIENTTDENVANRDIENIHKLVRKLKQDKEVGINYMKSWEREKMIRDEGVQEGIQQGIQEGMRQGIKILIQTCKEFGSSKEDTVVKVKEKYALADDEAEQYILRYWED